MSDLKSSAVVGEPASAPFLYDAGPAVESTNRPKHTAWDAETLREPSPSGKSRAGWPVLYARRLALTDLAVSLAAVAAAYFGRFGLDNANVANQVPPYEYVGISLLILILWNADLALFRTRERQALGAGATEYKRVLTSTLRAFGLLAIIMVVFQLDIVRGFFAMALPLGMVLLVADRWLWRRWIARRRAAGSYLSNAVVLGSTDDVRYVISQLQANPSTGFRVAGVAVSSLDLDTEIDPSWYRVPVQSNMADIARVVRRSRADAVIVAGNLPGGPQTIQELGWRLGDLATELVLASSLTNVAGPRVHFRPVEGLPLMHVEMPRYSGGKHVYKRAADVVLSSMALAVLTPLLLVLGLIVRLDSHGPALFRQERIGRNGESFRMLKFRSMVVDADAQVAALAGSNEGAGVLFKMANDPRVTKCGRWMRKFSLDELPQFWNVLVGHMSLVGPRPPLAREVAQYRAPAHRRLLIKPGITGLWQINGRSNLAWDEAVRLDLYYVENWSLTGDLIILWRTAKAVYAPEGAY
ncbi:sugar transferase [Arthrobacter dokdonensis]|uniref:sugar transferase n=1 Tax=Arthrobacter dokdonellae TaxID=2211210 RepID=UPI001D130853|nr:sugar transferase [Arthrobacter dokdonellae]